MSFPLPEKFKPGTPLRDMITTEIMQTVAGILNHIVIEEVEGLTRPQILKTAQPGRDTPWRIQVPPASAPAPDIELSDSAPPADGGSGSPGSSPLAARGDHQHPANVDGNVPPADTANGSAGSATTYARRDHSHPANVDDSTPSPVAATGSSGSSTKYSKADHVHAGVQLTNSPPEPLGSSASAGSASTAARADHVHAGSSGPALSSDPTAAVGPSGAPGSGAKASRSDHTHALPLGLPFVFVDSVLNLRTDFQTAHQDAVFGYHYTPSGGYSWGFFAKHSIIPAGANQIPPNDISGGNAGSLDSWIFANWDHRHPLNVDGSNPRDIASSPSPGSSEYYARADHVHKGPSLSGSTPQSDTGSGYAGVGTEGSKSDHRHPLNVDGYSPPDVSPTGGGTGSADVYARRDHTHKVICTMPGGLSQVNLFPANAAQTSAYGQGFTADSFRNNNQYAVVRRVTRVVFNTAATPPTLLEFYQEEKVLPSGQIVEISAEHVRTIATTVAHA